MKTTRPHGPRRGVSLIEAIVALAVMAFGLVAIVGLQATLRSNADISKQRAEAVRMAQQEIERWRAFVSLQVDAGLDYADIDDVPVIQTVGLNATYVIRRRVPDPLAAPKTVSVSVSWNDRTGQPQNVALNTAIAGISPELAGALVLPQNVRSDLPPNNRHVVIPRKAKNFGDGTSGFVPPQGQGKKVAWVFNNITGLIERTCVIEADASNDTLTAAAVATTLDNCDSSRTAQLLSGYVNFADLQAQPDEAQAEAPMGQPFSLDMDLQLTSSKHPEPGHACFDDSDAQLEAAATRVVTYFCAVYSNEQRTWSGRLRVLPPATLAASEQTSWTIGNEARDFKICRYTVLADDGNDSARNSAHPLDYTLKGSAPGTALQNQNFLVIRGSHSCPTDSLTELDPVNSNTRVHQNGVHPYT